MDHHLFFPLNILPHQIEFFDGAAEDLNEECHRTNEFISRRGSIDLILVGLGLNGHLGMNEPGVDYNLDAHIASLAEQTKETAKKYFDYEVTLKFGLTLGPRHILESKLAVLIVSGSKKAAILAQALEGELSNNVPAGMLQKHANAYCFIDNDAAALLSA
jgi:6-phosphogluconolactonase/glucosamine-6-phosphate isomerase/deaminase